MSNQDLFEFFGTVRAVSPRPVANSLAEFDVTSDSVVVKVRVRTTQGARRIFIDWGDDQNDTLWILPGRPEPIVSLGEPLPEGVFEFYHAYELPPDSRPFEQTLLLHVENTDGTDDLRLKTVRLVPRFTVAHYGTYVRVLDPCDFGGSTAEFHIDQYIDDEPVGSWDWEPSNSFFSPSIYQVLPGSHFTRVMTTETNPSADEYTPPISIRFDFTEKDPGPDQHGTHRRIINPYSLTEVSETVETDVKVDKTFGSCTVRLRYGREVILRAELPQAGGWATFDRFV